MSAEFSMLQSFMEQLAKTGMRQEDILARGFDYALCLRRSQADRHLPRGGTISDTLHVQLMDTAADLLKAVVVRDREGGRE